MRAASAIEPSTWVAPTPTPPNSWSTSNSSMVASMEPSSSHSQQPASLTEAGPSTTPAHSAHTADSATSQDGSVKSDCSHPEAVASTSTGSGGGSQSPSAVSDSALPPASQPPTNPLGAFSRRVRCSFRIPLKVAQRLKRIASTQPYTLRRIGVNSVRIGENNALVIADVPSQLEQMRLKQQQEKEQQKHRQNEDSFDALERVASLNSSSTTPNGIPHSAGCATPAPLSSGGRSSSGGPRAASTSLSSSHDGQPHPLSSGPSGPPPMLPAQHPLQRTGSVCNNNSPLLVNLLSSQQQNANAMGGSGSGTPLSQAGSGVAAQQQQQPLSAAASGGSGSNTPHPSAVPPPQQPGQGMPIHSPMLPPGGNVQRSFSPYNIPPGQHVDPHQIAIMQQQQRAAMMHHQMQQQAMHGQQPVPSAHTPNAQPTPTTPTSAGGYYGQPGMGQQSGTPMQPNTPQQAQQMHMQPRTPMSHMNYPPSGPTTAPVYPPPGGMPPNQMMQQRMTSYPPTSMPPQGQPPAGFRPMPPAEESVQPPPKKKRKPTKKQLKEAEQAAAAQAQAQAQAQAATPANQPPQGYYGDRMMPHGAMPGQFVPHGYPGGAPPGYGPMPPHGMAPTGQPPSYPGYPQGAVPHPQQQQMWQQQQQQQQQQQMQQRMMYQQQGWMPHGPPMQRGLPVPYPSSSQQHMEQVPQTPASRPEYGDASCSSTPTTPHSGHGYPHSHIISPSHPGYARSDSQNSFGYPPMPRDIPQQQQQQQQQQQTAQPQTMQQQHRLQSQNDFSNIPTQDENLDDLGDLDDIEPMNELSTSGSMLNASQIHPGEIKNENGDVFDQTMNTVMEGPSGMSQGQGQSGQLSRRPSSNQIDPNGGNMQQMDPRMMQMGMQPNMQQAMQMQRNAQMQRGENGQGQGQRLINGHEQPNGARRNTQQQQQPSLDGAHNDEIINNIVKSVVEEDKRRKETEQKTKQTKKRQPKKAQGAETQAQVNANAAKVQQQQGNPNMQANMQNIQQAQMQQ